MTATQRARPEWFDSFLADRGTQKRSAHTLAAYCRDFDAIAEIIVGGTDLTALRLSDINRDALRTAFALFAPSHAAASVRRCWSTWNTLCTDLYDDELIPANPMGSVGRPRSDETLSKALPPNVIDALLDTLDADQAMPRRRRDDWVERDRAMLLTALLAGLRLEELVGINFGDIRLVGDGAVVHVRGKGRKDRRVPIEAPLIRDLKVYLASRRTRFPSGRRGSSPPGDWAVGQLTLRYSSAPRTAPGSRAAPCSTGFCGCFAGREWTLNASAAPWSTACGIPSPPTSPTRKSVSTN